MQYLRALQHLQHEGGLGVGQVIGGANAGVDGVNRAQPAGRGRHMGAHAGQQHNHRNLAHVSRLAAHVGAGDDLHALLGPQARVVGNEVAAAGLGQAGLHHRVAALGDVQAGLFYKLRGAPVQRQGALGQGAQRIQRGQGAGQAGQPGDEGLQLVQHLLIEPLFTGQGPFLGAQGLVFKGLEFGGDETLGILERLAAAVVVGHFVDLPLGDLNEEAVHFVELHPQVGNAGAGFFAHFQVEQKTVAVGLDGAQLVQVGIKAAGDHAAVSHQGGGLGVYGAGQ